VAIENCSGRNNLHYDVAIAPTTDTDNEPTSWVRFSHSGGIIAAAGSSTLLLYISRQQVGKFSANLVITNRSNSLLQTPQLVAIRVEIIPAEHE
jgi:hypothetical protein